MSKEELLALEVQLKNIIVDTYDPTSTRLRRNYTDCAEWYFLWSEKRKRDDQFHSMMFITTPPVKNSFYSRTYQKMLQNGTLPVIITKNNFSIKDFEEEYECKFTMKDEPPFGGK